MDNSVIVAIIGAIATVLTAWISARKEGPGAMGQEGPPGPGLALPIGSIVGFWGSLDELPKGYELCDGELVTTPDSPLNGSRKPNFVDRFLKGAVPGVKDVREKPETGGADSVTLTHSHPAGTLYALIIQKAVSGHNFNIPLVTRGSFNPTNG